MNDQEAAALGWRKMLDSASPAAIMRRLAAGERPDLVAGYPDFGWSDADFEAVTDQGIQVVRITQHEPPDWQRCSVADWEDGAIGHASQLQGFVSMRNDFRPFTATVYESESNLVNVGVILAGYPVRSWWAWVAWWTGTVTTAEVTFLRTQLRAGARLAAVQDKSRRVEDVDESWVIDPAWHPAR
jgi:hypothetical protein